MEKYVVIKIGSRQYTVRENDVFVTERQEKPVKASVLFYSDGAKNLVGEPFVKDVVLEITEVAEKRDRKIRVSRFKAKSRYRKGKGHRQALCVYKVEKISLAGEKESKAASEPKETKEASTEKSTQVKASAKATVQKEKAKSTSKETKSVKKTSSKSVSKKLPKKVTK